MNGHLKILTPYFNLLRRQKPLVYKTVDSKVMFVWKSLFVCHRSCFDTWLGKRLASGIVKYVKSIEALEMADAKVTFVCD